MKNHRTIHSHPDEAEPALARLAQGSQAAVDLCQCGMLHVHIGPVTLRLDAAAFSDLLTTLGQAKASRSAYDQRELAFAGAMTLHGSRRGDA